MNQHPLSSLPLERLIDETCRQLDRLGYKPNTIKRFRQIWLKLMCCAQEHDVQFLTSELINKFLQSFDIPLGESTMLLSAYQRQVRVCMRILEGFSLYGCQSALHSTTAKASFPPEFDAEVKSFLEHRKVQHGNTQGTLSSHKLRLLRFTSFLKSSGIRNWTDVNSQNMTEFLAMQTYLQPRSLGHLASTLRLFLKYLWLQGIHPKDLSSTLLHLRVQDDESIPSVWQREDVEALLGAVDRGSPLGKRNYAILLLAARLGLRTGEIRTLKLDNIHWEKAVVELFQPKTGNTVLLPLSEEVGQALIDYLRHGRPPVTCREVFVRHRVPFEPFAWNNHLHYIVTTYRRKAKIKFKRPIHYGLHSLRHTLASYLLEQGTPMETIANILGHATIETTRTYTKVDLKALRSAALDPEEVCYE
jgi:site-specific recombinase XerD